MDESWEDLKFEEALAQLEEIVTELEQGELSLEEAVEKFQRGMLLKQLCERRLNEAEAKLEEYAPCEESEAEAESLFE